MARLVIRPWGMDAQTTTALTFTLLTTTGTTALALDTGLMPRFPGQRIDSWWIYRTTKGTGGGTRSSFLVVNGGTASTRQISGAILQNQTDAAGMLTGGGYSAGMYEVAAGDVGKALALVETNSTTATNGDGSVFIGVVWAI